MRRMICLVGLSILLAGEACPPPMAQIIVYEDESRPPSADYSEANAIYEAAQSAARFGSEQDAALERILDGEATPCAKLLLAEEILRSVDDYRRNLSDTDALQFFPSYENRLKLNALRSAVKPQDCTPPDKARGANDDLFLDPPDSTPPPADGVTELVPPPGVAGFPDPVQDRILREVDTHLDGATVGVALAFSNPGDPCTRLAAVQRELRAILDSAAPHLKAATQSGLDARFGARLAALRADCRPPGDTPPARPPGPNDDLFVPGAPTSTADLEGRPSAPPEVLQIPTDRTVDPKVEEAIGPVGGILAGPGSPCAKVEAVSALVRDNYRVLDPLQIESLESLIEARHGMQLNYLRNACRARDDSPGALPPEPSDFVPGLPAIPNPAPPPPTSGGFSYDPETDRVGVDVGMASDSGTFCEYRPGTVERVTLTPVPTDGPPPTDTPPSAPPPSVRPPCPSGSICDPAGDPVAEQPPGENCPSGGICGPGGNPPSEPLPDDLLPVGERNPCDELAELTARFNALRTNPGVAVYDRPESIPLPNRAEIASILPRMIELVALCGGPCERQKQLLRELADAKEEVAAIERSRRALGLPVQPRDLTQADLTVQALMADLATIKDAECPQIEGFLELLSPPPATPPTRQPPQPPSEPPPSQPEPTPPTAIVNVKATTRALQEGGNAPELAGQVIRLFDLADLNVALPTAKGEKPQDGHDRGPTQAVTDAAGFATLSVELTPERRAYSLTLQRQVGASTSRSERRYQLDVDATPQDSINLISADRAAIDAVLAQNGLPGTATRVFRVGDQNVATLNFDRQERDVIMALQGRFPLVRFEPNLCRIKEPAAVTEYHACKIGERTPPPGTRILVPPAPHAELRGARITLDEIEQERGE